MIEEIQESQKHHEKQAKHSHSDLKYTKKKWNKFGTDYNFRFKSNLLWGTNIKALASIKDNSN